MLDFIQVKHNKQFVSLFSRYKKIFYCEKMSKIRVAWPESNLISPAEMKTKLKNTNSQKTSVVHNLEGQLITSHLYQALFPIYHLSKICGLLPVKFSPLGKGLYSVKLRKIEILYGFLFVLILISIQTWCLYRDLDPDWKKNIRLSSYTSVTVICSDVIAVAGIVVIAVLSFPCRWKYLQKSMNKLAEVDEEIRIVPIRKLQRKAIILIICPLAFLALISVCELFLWLDSKKNEKLFTFVVRDIFYYIPIYIMYFVNTVFEIQYALAILYIGELFARMNQIMERLLKSYKINEYCKGNLGLVLAFMNQRKMTPDIRNLPGRKTRVSDWLIAGNDNHTIANGISLLITLHGNLCESALFLNSAFGMPLIFTTLSSVHHLIITPYFAYTEFSSKNRNYKVMNLQIIWIIYHLMGLLLTVEPCYRSTLKARKMRIIISQLLTFKWDSKIRKQLEIFSLQILQRPLIFSACGLFSMDRTLLTSIAGAVTTYLVILIQFQVGDSSEESLRNVTQLIKTLTANALKKHQ